MPPRSRWVLPAWLVIVAAALIAIAPLLVHGCSCGHDFDFHLVSWMEAASQLRHGELHPQWAFSPAYNAGEPRFVFYPPLSWYLGAAIGLVLTHLPRVSEAAGWSAAPIAYTAIALLLAGWTMYRLAREFADNAAATFAAVLYMTNPYMLFTAFERTAYAELLAAAWMPMLVHGILRDRVTLPRIAAPLALLWLTNAPAAVIGSYTLALLAVVRIVATLWSKERGLPWMARVRAPLQLTARTLGGTALGLLIAAFYIAPAAYEQRYVQIGMAILPGLRIQDNFLFHHTTGPDSVLHDQVLHTASLIAVTLWAVGIVALLVLWSQSRKQERRPGVFPALPLIVLNLLVGFLLTPWSRTVWLHAPEASFLQFPWRGTFVLAVIAALGFACMLQQPWLNEKPSRTGALAMIVAIPLAWSAFHAFHQRCDPVETPDARLAVFHSSKGSDPTDEYTPAEADNDVLRHNDPPYWTGGDPSAAPPATSALLPGPAPMHLEIRSTQATNIILNLRAYPAWEVLLDGAPDLQRVQRDDGLLALPIPAGPSTIDIRWVRLPDQKVGDLATLVGVGLLTASLLPARWRTRRRS